MAERRVLDVEAPSTVVNTTTTSAYYLALEHRLATRHIHANELGGGHENDLLFVASSAVFDTYANMSLLRPPTMVGDRALAPRRTLIHGYTVNLPLFPARCLQCRGRRILLVSEQTRLQCLTQLHHSITVGAAFISGHQEMTLWRDERDDESLTPLLWTTPCFEGGRLKERVYLEWRPSSYASWEGDDEDSVA
ncbi:hypothetical protein BDZ89DRAFT_1051637 [Hymenopellis radicata]|nr:hypothetical protein BDZ89DRAFT_1054800 [Hymenopellis radicata]KAF8998330.1 hypothetical protein BDZ89DRAFT_1051637 [Hymenopellis radicata]